ncbi:hypothetical protein Pan216_42970 [Planctomycetes bacterium Pan216]|uniref:Uncharacterized protein n=1 Tax=Kolteria novifilia TaxID=2527975 RepID=A0A518B8Z6_9BACT|nr:hypothetical protein Pan216_42970 [Planctomycetes bacterium Pan216]
MVLMTTLLFVSLPPCGAINVTSAAEPTRAGDAQVAGAEKKTRRFGFGFLGRRSTPKFKTPSHAGLRESFSKRVFGDKENEKTPPTIRTVGKLSVAPGYSSTVPTSSERPTTAPVEPTGRDAVRPALSSSSLKEQIEVVDLEPMTAAPRAMSPFEPDTVGLRGAEPYITVPAQMTKPLPGVAETNSPLSDPVAPETTERLDSEEPLASEEESTNESVPTWTIEKNQPDWVAFEETEVAPKGPVRALPSIAGNLPPTTSGNAPSTKEEVELPSHVAAMPLEQVQQSDEPTVEATETAQSASGTPEPAPLATQAAKETAKKPDTKPDANTASVTEAMTEVEDQSSDAPVSVSATPSASKSDDDVVPQETVATPTNVVAPQGTKKTAGEATEQDVAAASRFVEQCFAAFGATLEAAENKMEDVDAPKEASSSLAGATPEATTSDRVSSERPEASKKADTQTTNVVTLKPTNDASMVNAAVAPVAAPVAQPTRRTPRQWLKNLIFAKEEVATTAAPVSKSAEATADAGAQPIPTTVASSETTGAVVAAGCPSCGGGFSSNSTVGSGLAGVPTPVGAAGGDAGAPVGDCPYCTGINPCGQCVSCCAAGHRKCYPACDTTNPVHRAVQLMYECIVCPDPCYELSGPHYNPIGNAALFVDHARPRSQTRLRWDAGQNLQTPDRSNFFWNPAATATNIRTVNGVTTAPSSVDYDRLSMYVETATKSRKFSAYVDTTYLSVDPNVGDRHAAFSDMLIGTKSLLFDCELFQIAFQLENTVPIGNLAFGTSKGIYAIEPSILYSVKLLEDLFYEGQLSEWIGFGSATAGGVFHHHHSFNKVIWKLNPDVLLINTYELEGWAFQSGQFTTADNTLQSASGGRYYSIGTGLRMWIGDIVDCGVGVQFGLTDPSWAAQLYRFEGRLTY